MTVALPFSAVLLHHLHHPLHRHGDLPHLQVGEGAAPCHRPYPADPCHRPYPAGALGCCDDDLDPVLGDHRGPGGDGPCRGPCQHPCHDHALCRRDGGGHDGPCCARSRPCAHGMVDDDG